MTISGIGATPEQPEQPSKDIDPQNPKKPENSIWIKFTDNDGKVDINDVEILDGPQEYRNIFAPKIQAFLEKHQTEQWNDELFDKIGKVFNIYKEYCDKWLENSRKQTESEKNSAIDKQFEQIKDGYINEFKNFETGANNELKQFNKEGAYKALDDLESGFNGYLNIDGVGIVTYNADSALYTINYTSGTTKNFNKSGIREEIDKHINNGCLVSGNTKKTVHE